MTQDISRNLLAVFTVNFKRVPWHEKRMVGWRHVLQRACTNRNAFWVQDSRPPPPHPYRWTDFPISKTHKAFSQSNSGSGCVYFILKNINKDQSDRIGWYQAHRKPTAAPSPPPKGSASRCKETAPYRLHPRKWGYNKTKVSQPGQLGWN